MSSCCVGRAAEKQPIAEMGTLGALGERSRESGNTAEDFSTPRDVAQQCVTSGELKYYREVVKLKEAARYWQIMPEKVRAKQSRGSEDAV
ncbi:hypothetical protein ACXR0O_08880 [Verrucomicrobiota bacterium sgz303538]